MFNKIVLILIIAMLLLGAAMTSTSIPVLWGMGFLILLALSMIMRSENQG
jgi:hypothetical protein